MGISIATGIVATPGISGTLSVPEGGTGATSFTIGAVLLGNGVNPIQTDSGLTYDTATDRLAVGFTGTKLFGLEVGADIMRIGSTSGSSGVGIRGGSAFGGGDNVVKTDGFGNSFLGRNAGPPGHLDFGGFGNLGIGGFALTNLGPLGDYNVGIGTNALSNLTTGDNNLGLGTEAGLIIDTGSFNVAIGFGASPTVGAAFNRIAIGCDTSIGLGAFLVDTDNQVFLGDDTITAWVPGSDGGVDLGRSDRQFDQLFFDNSLVRSGSQVVGARITGWTAPTGTASRAGFNTTTGTLNNALQTLKGLIDDLVTHGLIGA